MNTFVLKKPINDVKKSLGASLGLTITKPLEISVMPNKRCNARCLMCDFWKEQNDYLTSEEILRTLKELRSWVGSGFFLQIAGGEPLIFKGIYDIFSYCADNGIICKISTNGYALTESVCRKIIDSKLSYLTISLDSHLSEVHDKMRGVQGIWEQAVKGIKYLAQNSSMTLGISSVLMKDNVQTFPESIDYFLSLPIHRVLIQPVGVWTEDLPTERWSEYEYWVNDGEAMSRLVAYMSAKKKEDARILNTEKDFLEWKKYFENPAAMVNNDLKKCKIGYDKLAIAYQGDISLGCSHYGGVIGNIKTGTIKEAWYSAKADKMRRQMMRCKMPCQYSCYKELSFTEKLAKAKVLIKSGLFSR